MLKIHRFSLPIHSSGTVFFFSSLALIEVIFTDFKVCGDFFVLFLFTGTCLFENKHDF